MSKDKMSEKEIERLEREREKLEEARERLEEERERLEEERERMEEEAGETKRRVIVHREELTEEQREKIERAKEHAKERLEKAQARIEIAMDGIDDRIENALAGIDFDKINESVQQAMENIDFDKMNRDIEIAVEKSTKNVGVLNLKDITTEELEKMGPIKNVGVIIVPEELMSKVSAKIIKNIGTVVPYKKGWRIYSGSTTINKSMLEALDEPLEFIQTGNLTIAEDVPEKLVKDKVKAFHNYGHVQATEETYGVLMAKCLENYGNISQNGHDEDEDE